MARVVCDELHDIPILHEFGYDRKLRGYPYEGQDVFMLKPLPPNDLSGKQLESLRE